MLYDTCYLCLMFLFYSIFGYVVEIAFCSYHANKVIINRGFLIGPYLPIYGSSVVLMYMFLYKYQDDPITLFVMCCFICSVMEFFTSYFLEKIFKVRWWDYSDKRFDLDGRICLTNSLLFGLGGLAIFYILNPIILPLFNKMSEKVLIILTLSLMAIFIIDVIISIVVLIELKISSINFSSKDVTEELIILRNEKLRKNSLLLKRLLNAFPKIEGKDKEQLVEMKKMVNRIRERIKEEKNKKRRIR